MPKKSRPRFGSLQYWPRKRARKALPSVNWKVINGSEILGFIVYKVGMKSAIVKDNTPNSMTKGKRIELPVTILEAPFMKIFSVRLYKNNKVLKEIILNSDTELKKILKLPKNLGKIEDLEKDSFDNIKVIAYSQVKSTNIKKTPDLVEIGIGGSKEEKINFIKENAKKEISILEVFKNSELVDVRGLTKGRGLSGPVKRFGIGLKSHKSEKGRRRPGSLGPWHPARVTFRVPMSGQLGMFTRINYNNKIISLAKITEKNINPSSGFKHFGNIKTEYLILSGSVQGPSKRQLLLTKSLRKTKKQDKKNYELIDLN
ncbi:MAG: 50S ribosomal protein L3 [archaeon]